MYYLVAVGVTFCDMSLETFEFTSETDFYPGTEILIPMFRYFN